jgi:hypothetical protein
MKVIVCWIVAPCSLVGFSDVLEVLAASMIRAVALIMWSCDGPMSIVNTAK